MEHLKQRFSKNSPRGSFLNDRPEDSQESFLGEDSDAFTGFRKSKTDADANTDSKSEKTDITLRLKLSDSLDDIHLAANGGRTDSVENGNGFIQSKDICLAVESNSGFYNRGIMYNHCVVLSFIFLHIFYCLDSSEQAMG